MPDRAIKAILTANGLGFNEAGRPSWWYEALDGRNAADDLTHFELDYITEHVARTGSVLVTGCGVGLSTIPLFERGYHDIEGFDYLPNVVAAAQAVAKAANVPIKYWQMDGFRPKLTRQYDCITAMHWVYSAWMGNYTNPVESRVDRELILREFLEPYAEALRPGGSMLVELVDANMLDNAFPPYRAYPIRHTPEQVATAAQANGLNVALTVTNPFGQRSIVVLYVLSKTSAPEA
ncbi:MAG TPA: methyltransferase domain-containing protein [Bryobacteraceae bacterium]|nr:methyltransferase domain-containing protein [Bryobacteraceae bacterium]